MYDSNGNNKVMEEKSNKDSKDVRILLKDMALELEDKLYSVKVQLKTQMNLLAEKENELSERERIKVHNLDLFSPIYNKIQDEKDLIVTIDQIKQAIEELNKEQEQLTDRINGLKTAAGYLDSIEYKEETADKDKLSEGRVPYNDKGLSILEAQEIDRQRIARDLHDSTVQSLTSLVHKAELCVKLIDIDTTRAKLELTSMSNTIKTVINDMRGIIYNLKPMTLDDLGLTITLERYANRLMDLNNINVIIHSNEETKEILPVIKVTLFRIIQEACNNVIKHANASIISIDINYEEHYVTVSIKDNGAGFDINNSNSDGSKHSSSFGLSIMKERISLLSGTVDIKSEKGKGTTVIVSAPLTMYEGEKHE
jgi:two-component system sensor histidine kinase DegS